MAGSPRVYWRNWDSSDNTNTNNGSVGGVILTASEVGFSAPTGKEFVNWNTARDGSGTTVEAGVVSYLDVYLYAIWQEIVDVTITYQGNTIATMSASGTKTLLTAANYCESDIVVSYTKPSADLQAKTNISPTTSSQTISADAGYDGLSSVQINAMPSGSATTPATSITANPSISVNSSTGVITATASATQSITPTVSAGYVASGTAGTVTVSGSNTSNLTTQGAQTITPTTSDQTIASGKYLTGAQTIKGDANLVAGNIKKDVAIFGVTGSYEGGASSYTLLLSTEKQITTTSTTYTQEYIDCSINLKKWTLIRVRDKAGARNGYFYGSDSIFAPQTGTAASTAALRVTYYVSSNTMQAYVNQMTAYGVYANRRTYASFQIYKVMNATYAPIVDGTYIIEAYQLEDPTGSTPVE